jgi:putative transposase
MALYRNRYRVISARLSGWDYSSAGYYHVTICSKGKIPFFEEVEDEEEESK